MRLYAEEGIRHFYFMMLQKDEVRSICAVISIEAQGCFAQFIDATKRGGIGRFANHSCNPNCYVAKWTVGDRVRMGIFANRAIKKDEERGVLKAELEAQRKSTEVQTEQIAGLEKEREERGRS